MLQDVKEKNEEENENKGEEKTTRFINPFKREDEQKILLSKTHNRRRWSQIFFEGQLALFL